MVVLSVHPCPAISERPAPMALPWPDPVDPTLPALDGFVVRRVPGFQARKEYRCPDCAQGIASGLGHVVAWPDGFPDDRRHWHAHCWRIASRRGRVH